MSDDVKKRTVKPAKYGPDMVRDISVQVAIAHLNKNPALIAAKLADDPKHFDSLRDRSLKADTRVRVWLEALDEVSADHPNYRQELMYSQSCLGLEPTMTRADRDKAPEREKELRATFMRHLTDWHWDVNCAPYVEAIERVKTRELMVLRLPETV